MARSTNGKNEATYLLNGIPGDLWDKAKEQAAAHRPPISMRWLLIGLLEKWVQAGTSPKPKAAEAKAPKPRKPRKAAPTWPSAPTGGAPDLGDTF